ncbi:MAG: hypothetical protein ACK4ZY_12470 [Sphingomonas sp.]
MLGAIVFTYGMLTSFVLQGASRNARLARPNPPMLQYIGYVLCGLSAGLSAMLLLMAFTAKAPFPLV